MIILSWLKISKQLILKDCPRFFFSTVNSAMASLLVPAALPGLFLNILNLHRALRQERESQWLQRPCADTSHSCSTLRGGHVAEKCPGCLSFLLKDCLTLAMCVVTLAFFPSSRPHPCDVIMGGLCILTLDLGYEPGLCSVACGQRRQ